MTGGRTRAASGTCGAFPRTGRAWVGRAAVVFALLAASGATTTRAAQMPTDNRPATTGAEMSILDRNHDGQITIACLGDSNTSSIWQHAAPGGFPSGEGWCEILGQLLAGLPVRMINRGLGAATVSPRDGVGLPGANLFFSGYDQLDSVLVGEGVDVVLFAFGTNDVLPENNGDPSSIVDHYNRLARRAKSSGALPVVALTPAVGLHPKSGKTRRSLAAITETNERITEMFPARHTVGFDVVFDAAEFLDDLHLNGAGQKRRARTALRALQSLAGQEPRSAGIRSLRWQAGLWSDGDPGAVVASGPQGPAATPPP